MNFEHEDLKIEIKTAVGEDTNGYVMTWIGKSKAKNPGDKLDPYLEQLIPRIIDTVLYVDFRVLEFMNSSTVPSIISFANNLEKNGIRTIFWYDESKLWQVASFRAFDIFTQKMKHISLEAR